MGKPRWRMQSEGEPRNNDEGSGRVFSVAGIMRETTKAAGKYFLNPVSEVLHALGCTQIKNLPDYELLLRTTSVGGAGRSAKLLYARRLKN